MKSIAISGSVRGTDKKSQAKQIRNEGSIPCILYGGEEIVHFAAPEAAFKYLVYTPHAKTVELKIDGKDYNAIMKDIQFHPVTDKILHIDFLQLHDEKPVVMDIPVKLNGSASGVKEGGRLILKLRNLKVKCIPSLLPDKIEIDINDLSIGKAVRVSDIVMEGVEMLDASNNIIVTVKVTREVVEEKPAAGATTTAAGATPAAGAAAPATGAPGAAPAKGAAPAPAKK
jgi:large subunit ribosomal protein L25